MTLLPRTLAHLARLVAFDTRNPPRRVAVDDGLFAYARASVGRDVEVEARDLGDGQVWMLLARGAPDVLVNVHVDTVPAADGWRTDPLRLIVDDAAGTATGLGAADIKGAAAAALAALEATTGPAAILLSSDEEAGSSACVKDFVATQATRWRRVVVCEPTSCRAILAHRGIATATATFTGVAGHASAARALDDSAVHALVRWGARVLDRAAQTERDAPDAFGLRGLRVNVGAVEGGVKANMIASKATARVGCRPPPSLTPDAALELLASLAEPGRASFARGFVAPPLPATAALHEAGRALAASLGLPVGDAVDFWTEAALFSAAGAAAIVYGPGDIAVAHAPDEAVPLADLARAADDFARFFGGPA